MIQVLALTVDPLPTNGLFADHSSKPTSKVSAVKINPIEQFDPSKIWDRAGSMWLGLA
jgi:hypothetical protein